MKAVFLHKRVLFPFSGGTIGSMKLLCFMVEDTKGGSTAARVGRHQPLVYTAAPKKARRDCHPRRGLDFMGSWRAW